MLKSIIASFCLLATLFFSPLSATADVPAFTFADVQAKAQDLARAPYAATPAVPEFLSKMSHADWHTIRFRPEKAVWASEELPFNIQFFHPGLYYDRPVSVHVFDSSSVTPVTFDAAMFQ